MIKQTLLKVLILLFSTNQIYATIPLNKFKSEESLTDFVETPTRFIVINQDKCDAGVGCDNVVYYEINRKTGKTFKIAKGKTINVGPDQSFRGYEFTTKDRKSLHTIVIQGESLLTIMHPKTYKMFSQEEIRKYLM